MEYIFTNIEYGDNLPLMEYWEKNIIKKYPNGNLFLLSPKRDLFYEEDGSFMCLSGYVRSHSLVSHNVESHNKLFFKNIIGSKWPLPDCFTGHFSALAYNHREGRLILANDVIGFHPIYYYINKKSFVISSSEILAGILLGCKIDETGVAQRTLGPSYNNWGRRTIIKDLNRLLPGECISINCSTSDSVVEKFYDNRLYGEMAKIIPCAKEIAQEAYKAIASETEIAFRPYEKLVFGLSGGLDCRLLFATIDNKEIFSVTYGRVDNYESKIAQKVSSLKGSNFIPVESYDNYLPPKEMLLRYIITTEATSVNAWPAVLEELNRGYSSLKEIPFVLGDMYSALIGRSIRSKTSRRARIRDFFEKVFLNRPYNFIPNNEENFAKWREETKCHIMKKIDSLDVKNIDKIKRETADDVDLLIDRISMHSIPFVELVEELFDWYHLARFGMAKQLLMAKRDFLTISPIMSFQNLLYFTAIHPGLRLNYKLYDLIYKSNNELKIFNRIPTAQSPFIPFYFPLTVKHIVWGVRSFLDQILIKRMVRRKNPYLRYRLLKSIPWPELYQYPEFGTRLESYFQKDFINKREYCLRTFYKRRNLEKWPIAPFDLLNLSSLNLALEILDNNKLRKL